MKLFSRKILAIGGTFSILITIGLFAASFSPVCVAIFATITVFTFIIWFYGTYQDVRNKLDKKEVQFIEEFSSMKSSLDSMLNCVSELNEKTALFATTCDNTRDKVDYYHHQVISKLDEPKRVQYDAERVKTQLQYAIDAAPQGSVLKIVCYGRRGYGYIVDYIAENPNIKVTKAEVILCKPNAHPLAENDATALETQIKKMLKNRIFSVYASDIPPSIRASAIYDSNNHPLWCSIESYSLGYEKGNTLTLVCAENYPINVETKNGNPQHMEALESVFKQEFDRLYQESTEAYLDENENIHYKKAGE